MTASVAIPDLQAIRALQGRIPEVLAGVGCGRAELDRLRMAEGAQGWGVEPDPGSLTGSLAVLAAGA